MISESRNRKTPQKNLRPATFTKLAVGLRRLLNISNVRQIPKQHLSDPIDPVADTEEPEPETRVPDTIMMDHTFDTIHSTIDAQFKFSSRPETPMVHFTILSLPSSEKLVDPSPVSPWAKIYLDRMTHFAQLDWLRTPHMASAMPLDLYLLLVFARDESAPSRFLPERAFYMVRWPYWF